MSKIWQHANREHPCPICNKTDWCTFGDRAMLCQRVASEHLHPSGSGWYHFYDSKSLPEFVPQKKAAPVAIDAVTMMRDFRQATQTFQFSTLADSLGVLPHALIAIGAAWASKYNAWAFPMKNGLSETIGIRLRNSSGFKWAVTGSKTGIFIPMGVVPNKNRAYCPEGPTDTAALLSIGCYAVGRPTNNSGVEYLRELCRQKGITEVVIIADNDDIKRLGNREGRPGIEGAEKLSKELRVRNCIWVPPVKDAREFVKLGGTKALIDSDVNNRSWNR